MSISTLIHQHTNIRENEEKRKHYTLFTCKSTLHLMDNEQYLYTYTVPIENRHNEMKYKPTYVECLNGEISSTVIPFCRVYIKKTSLWTYLHHRLLLFFSFLFALLFFILIPRIHFNTLAWDWIHRNRFIFAWSCMLLYKLVSCHQ